MICMQNSSKEKKAEVPSNQTFGKLIFQFRSNRGIVPLIHYLCVIIHNAWQRMAFLIASIFNQALLFLMMTESGLSLNQGEANCLILFSIKQMIWQQCQAFQQAIDHHSWNIKTWKQLRMHRFSLCEILLQIQYNVIIYWNPRCQLKRELFWRRLEIHVILMKLLLSPTEHVSPVTLSPPLL